MMTMTTVVSCIQLSLIFGLHHHQCHRERYTHYLPYINRLDLSGITFPMQLKQITKFERQNQLHINVYGYDEPEDMNEDSVGIIYPIRISTVENDNVPPERCIDLLLLTEEEISHYCLITNLQALVRPGNTHAGRVICRKCLWSFTSEERLENHKPYCFTKAQRIEMPSKDQNVLEFTQRQHSFKQLVDFVVYADFESILDKNKSDNRIDAQNATQRHVPCAFAYKLVSTIPEYSKELVRIQQTNLSGRCLKLMTG